MGEYQPMFQDSGSGAMDELKVTEGRTWVAAPENSANLEVTKTQRSVRPGGLSRKVDLRLEAVVRKRGPDWRAVAQSQSRPGVLSQGGEAQTGRLSHRGQSRPGVLSRKVDLGLEAVVRKRGPDWRAVAQRSVPAWSAVARRRVPDWRAVAGGDSRTGRLSRGGCLEEGVSRRLSQEASPGMEGCRGR
ncbi:hypothetical protein chiPu_0011074 [Chiloscyllium punctatum]|uniref:Uncharacterized protein n=1 Tax=Chiloscyllium punctatum TaxID=137246 RepID=A0A401SQD3_CHIPU|nr:hypothetical protein [Chiloscyllium punctatum]